MGPCRHGIEKPLKSLIASLSVAKTRKTVTDRHHTRDSGALRRECDIFNHASKLRRIALIIWKKLKLGKRFETAGGFRAQRTTEPGSYARISRYRIRNPVAIVMKKSAKTGEISANKPKVTKRLGAPGVATGGP